MDDVSRALPAEPPRARLSLDRVRQVFPLALLVLLCLAFATTSDRFLTNQQRPDRAPARAVLLVAAVAMTFVIVNGSIDLSVGSIVALTALVARVSSHSACG
jgi:ribose/xylose/arabinose/galactoside ABC-type transport system permease subunit